jgi:hypothetical protein
MRLRTPTVRLQLALLLAGCFDLWGCKWRKPLPVTRDAGPLVEVVEPPVRQKPSAGLDTPATALAEEREPNDAPEQAQELAPSPGSPSGQAFGIRGSLAAPTAQAAGKGDDDFYQLILPMDPLLLRAELSTGPRADVSLELLDEQGKRIALIDERGRGEGERLGNLLFGPSQRVHLRVRGSAGATDAADAAYRLQLTPASAPSGSEREPNDTALTATPVTGTTLTGALAWRRDEDVWVIALAEAMGRRAQPGVPPPGIAADAVLRVELDAPGVLPAVKVQLEAATAAAPTAAVDGGTAAPQLATGVDLGAASAGELRLRNVGIPAGSARAYVTVRAASFQKPPGAERYHLRLSVEPALEAAEVEPNDDCARATPLPVTDGEDQVRGFLWPGDVDCYRLKPPSPAMHRWKLQLSVPADECKASLELVRAEGGKPTSEPGAQGAPSTGGAVAPLALRARGDVLVRVVGQRRSTCFREPYRLAVQVEPDGGGTP